MNLFLASTFTLGLLSTFFLSLLLVLAYATGFINVYLLLGLTVLINLIMWLVGPRISDFIYGWLYDMEWMALEELRERDEKTATFIEATCEEYGFDVPKLGIIPDQNPNAFTYGSGRWNARLAVTEGLFEYLDENELMSVYAHEMGHIYHRDFIVMTVANTLLQLLFELYVISREMAENAGRKGKGPVLGVAVAAYIFYFIGKYVVLYLSRVREYYADQFAAMHTDPDYLSSALLKVSYGILANPSDHRLVKSTRNLGIQDHQVAKQVGLAYYNCKELDDFEPIDRVLTFDLVNPWAKIGELHSTHPLTGKRIKRLCGMSDDPLFDFDEIKGRVSVDYRRLYRGFAVDVAALSLPTLAMFGFPLLFFAAWFYGVVPGSPSLFGGGWMAAIGLAMMGRTLYKYPSKEPEQATVLELMGDIYASPVRGRPVSLDGTLIGKGIPGYVFSEDMMMQDDTGLMYLNYQHWLPFIGNILFSIGRVPDLVDEEAEISGWFLRGTTSHVGLRNLQTRQESIRGFVKLGGLISGALFVLIGIGLFLFL